MQGQLFSTDFLLRGICETPAWARLSADGLDAFVRRLGQLYAPFDAASRLNEAQTEDELIEPLLDALGWTDAWISQVNLSATGREDVPDFLLFLRPEAKARAMAEARDEARLRHGVALLEAKRWMRPLDRSDHSATGNRKRHDVGAPSSQMLRYLSRADVMSDRAVKWGILTNGAVWRLYWQDARSRTEDFFEVNVAALLGVAGVPREPEGLPAEHGLKLFALMFGRQAFEPQDWDAQRRSLHAIALAEARLYEERVSAQLGQRVFEEIFPALCAALAEQDLQARKTPNGHYTADYLEEVYEAALVLLYRLLFVFYAEDRRLLPVMDERYARYSLSALREEVAAARDAGRALSHRVANYWAVLDNLFTLIAEGDDTVGMPAYNGGLFERGRARLLARVKLPDAKLAPVIDALSRRVEDVLKARINYRDLSVAHLGSIYERLLEYRLQQQDGRLVASKAGFARRGSGSYYTHDALVRLVLDEAVGPLAAERQAAFEALLQRLRPKPSLNPAQWEALDAADPASRLLQLRICDPAMGSGHFLVALVDWLADRVLEAAHSSFEAVNGSGFAAHLVEQGRPWHSPVVARIADIRRRIIQAAHKHGWRIEPHQLDDRHIVRRMILKRVVYGVDKNPMAVELAKLALWLHTFTAGAPLSFLDHHLQCGDSLHGERLQQVRQGIASLGALFQDGELARLEVAAQSLASVAELTDTHISEAHESKRLAEQAAAELAPIAALLSLWRALRWRVPGWPDVRLQTLRDEGLRLALGELFSGRHNLVGVAACGRLGGETEAVLAANRLLDELWQLAKEERFFHWELAFPTVWRGGQGGFDAVIGNPPWDRIKLQEVEWFAERKPAIALQSRAADRKRLIEQEREARSALWTQYQAAAQRAETAARVVRECGDYPLLSGGDVNLYSLFVERAQSLVQPDGVVGLLTPSGIAADKGAAAFFRTLTEPAAAAAPDAPAACRLAALIDFENRKAFFPDVHGSFKFCVLIFGGQRRRFARSRCAFFVHDVAELADADRVLTLSGADFAQVNPNTGAAPVFRTRRDAELTLRIYRRHPVLINRQGGREERAWPVKYMRMFDMTNDSGLFLTRAELQRQGFEPAALNRWQRRAADGSVQEALPLYEGKMVQMYDHRAADVVLNPRNLHRPAQPESIADTDKARPDRYPQPQYWVTRGEVERFELPPVVLAFKDVTAPTNMRTMIAAMLPPAAYGNTLPVLELPLRLAVLLVANLNSLAFDFLARQKVQGQHLNGYILEQLPVIAPTAFETRIGGVRVADHVASEVLVLSYSAHDLAPLALELGHVDAQGRVRPPFVWDAEDRAHRMARLDALFFHLYGLEREDVEHVLEAFPIVREQDTAAHGCYRTREWVLGYYDRLRSGTLSHARL